LDLIIPDKVSKFVAKYFFILFKHFINNILLVFSTLFLFSCANIIAPTGGDIDNIPPGVLNCSPANYSINFNEKEIKIYFDEYIALRNITKSLIISPPLDNKPEVKIKGKSIIIKFFDTLKANTTYSLYFQNAIADITENNVLNNYQYTFSTGSSIDSLVIKGRVINSNDLSPAKDIFVVLHKDLSDSSVIKNIPNYISKTNSNGEFFISNIHEGNYHIFGLNDINSNFLFDLPNEDFAFYDSLIIPKVIRKEISDTIKKDSVIKHTVFQYLPEYIILKTFQEDRQKLYLSRTERKEKNKCVFIFSKPMINPVEIIPYKFNVQNKWNVIERNFTNDTIICWITDTLISNMDTLNFILKYQDKDFDEKIILQKDTAKRVFYDKSTIKKDNKTLKKDILKCNINKSTVLDLNKNIIIESAYPISEINYDKIILTEIKNDSVKTPVKYSYNKDSLNLRKFYIKNTWKENTNYKLLILPGAINDIYNLNHDTLAVNFKTQSSENYGNIILTVTNVKSNIILQMFSENNNLYSEFKLNKDKKININNVIPGIYYFKIIYDDNNDSKWTTGNYHKKIQPENIKFYNDNIKVRASWDVEINWDISK